MKFAILLALVTLIESATQTDEAPLANRAGFMKPTDECIFNRAVSDSLNEDYPIFLCRDI